MDGKNALSKYFKVPLSTDNTKHSVNSLKHVETTLRLHGIKP